MGCGFALIAWILLEACHVKGALGLAIAVRVLGQFINPKD